MNNIDITTILMNDGTYSFSFECGGNLYSNHDYLSRESALEDAHSIIRCLIHNIPLKETDCFIEPI